MYVFGLIDDHDECEWVNVSSGTGSPALQVLYFVLYLVWPQLQSVHR